MTEALRPYINEGDFVKAESILGLKRVEAGTVVRDVEGELRIDNGAGIDGPDGLPVNARWVNVLSWIKAAPTT